MNGPRIGIAGAWMVLALIAAPAGAGELLVRGATVHTLGARGVLEQSDVRVREGRIVEVGSALAAAGAEVIEANGRPLTPGLFGGITTLGIEEVSQETSTIDNAPHLVAAAGPGSAELRPEFDVRPAFDPDSAVIGVNRIEGLSWAMIAPSAMATGAILAGQGAVARLDGRVEAFLEGSNTLFVDLGADTAPIAGNSRAAQFMLLEQAAREAKPSGPMRDGDFRLLTPTGREVLARYLAGGRTAFNADRAADIRNVLRFARRFGTRALIVGGAEAWQVADLLAADAVPVILDPRVNLPDTFDQTHATLENAARLHRAGVLIVIADLYAGTHSAHRVRQSAGIAVANGLPAEAALAALTANPAAVFGLGTEFGRIEPGYAADLVLWSGDPLEVTTAADLVWIEGRAQPMRSRQSELRDRYRPRQ
jgi:hypothetical protein